MTASAPAPTLDPEHEASAQALLRRFPLPGFIFGRDGSLVFRNSLAGRRLSATWLAGAGKTFLDLGSGEQAAMVDVIDRTGSTRNVLAYSTPLQAFTVVVLDDRAAERGSEQAARLQRRIFELEQLSTTDPLTRLSNRRHFDEMVLRELAFSERDHSPLTLLLLDVDHFKLINDRFGHAVGDTVLRDTATRLRAAARATDTVFRWGGEEFAVLATATSATAGVAMAERMRAAVGARAFEGAGDCTISAGVAEHAVGEPPSGWFARLDAALYKAKESGRNRVVCAPGGASEAWLREPITSTLRLVWSPPCESGHRLIDAEHHALFDGANALMAALAQDSLPDGIPEQIDRLIAQIAAHFEHEEQVLAQAQYPRLQEHRGLHAKLLADAQRLSSAVRSGGGSPGEIVEFLAYEVVNRHILKADRQFFAWLQAEAPAAALPA